MQVVLPEADPFTAETQTLVALPARGPWGALATLGFGVLEFLVFSFLQTAVFAVYIVAHVLSQPRLDMDALLSRLETDGFWMAIATAVSAPGTIGAVLFAAWIRRGPPVRDYLGLRGVRPAVLLRWLGAAALLIVATDTLTWAVGQEVVPEWMVKVYLSARFLPLFLLGIVVAAPLAEEFLFRGFLIPGLQGRLGEAGAIALASLLWTLIHVQYGLFHMTVIFADGLLLGYARTRTGSLLPPILMHALVNLVATVEVAIVAR